MSSTENPAPAPIRLGMLWHSPNSGNLGVGALTLGNMELARRAAAAVGRDVAFNLIGFVDPGRPFYVSGENVAVTALDGKGILPGGTLDRALGGVDAVLDIGGGDSFTDIYGPKRFFYMSWTKFRVLARGLPLVLSPQTIGPFDRGWSRRVAARLMARARHVFARDPQSLAVARQLSGGAVVSQAADVAFAMPFEAISHGPGTHVGINVSGLLFNGGYSGSNEFGMTIAYADFTRKLVAALLARGGVTVHLVPHVLSDALPQDDDRAAIARLAQEFPQAKVAPDFPDPIAAKSYIAGLDLLVGGRMHACIAAHSSGVAVVPVAYSRKFAGLFGDLLDYPFMVPVTGMDTDSAVAFVLDCFDRREELAARTRAGREVVTARLAAYVEELTAIFREAGLAAKAGDPARANRHDTAIG